MVSHYLYGRSRLLFVSLFSFTVAALGRTIELILSPIRAALEIVQPDARTVLAIGGVAAKREPSMTPARSRFRARLARALEHADFRGGFFDCARSLG